MKQRTLCKLVGGALALTLALAMPLQALAAEWKYDLAEGSVTVSASEGGQTVIHDKAEGAVSATHAADDTVVIHQSNHETPTANTITIRAEENATAKVTIDNVNIKTAENSNNPAVVVNASGEGSKAEVTLKDSTIDTSGAKLYQWNSKNANGIDVQGASDVTLTLEGDNTVTSRNQNDAAAVHVGAGNLTIQGEGSLTASGGVGAAIGTNSFEDLTGSITIGGDAKVNAVIPKEEDSGGSDNDGAGIGTGYRGNITKTGSIHITDQAQVTASHEGWDSAGIGLGNGGSLSGTITIDGDAKVNGTSKMGAGIGGYYVGKDGEIIVGGNAQVTAKGGVGIGGEQRISGSVTIQDNATVDAQGGIVGIGGMGWRDGASVTIQDRAEVISGSDVDIAIGASTTYTSDNKVNIAIQDEANVTANGIIGAGYFFDYEEGESKPWTAPEDFTGFDSTATINGVKGDDISGLYWAGVLSLDPEDPRIVYPVPASDPAPASEPAREPVSESLYWVLDGDGQWTASQAERAGGVLTVTAAGENASFNANREGLAALAGQGVETVVFATGGKTSAFDVSEALASFASGRLVLSHRGGAAELTLDGEDHSALLK